MRKRLIVLLTILFVLVPFISLKAEEVMDGVYLLGTDSSLDDPDNIKEYFEYDEILNSTADDVYHNLFSIGKSIKTSGVVNGIHFALANKINILSEDDYGVYLGNDIIINSQIYNDLFVAGNTIRLLSEASVERDAYIAGNEVTINSDINGNVFVAASTLNIDTSYISGNLYIAASTINFGEDVVVDGIIKYNDNASIKNLKNVEAEEVKVYKISEEKEVVKEKTFLSKVADKLGSALSLSIVLIVLFVISPKLYNKLPKEIDEKLLNTGLVGLATLVFVPFVVILLLITVIGIPLGLLLLLVYILFVSISSGIASVLVGKLIYNKLLGKEENMYLEVLIGVFTVKLLSLVPVVGYILGLVCLLVGLGILTNLIIKKRN